MNRVPRKNRSRRAFLKHGAKLSLQLAVTSLIMCSCRRPDNTNYQTVAEDNKMTTTRSDFEPAYLKLHKTGELKKRADELWAIMESCQLCPRRCGVNRLQGASGFCRAPGATLVVSSFHPHFGEERPLVGIGGSGTIFLTHCNLRCVFCQNFDISWQAAGRPVSAETLARMMLELQARHCHNINLVTPSHVVPQILEALVLAAQQGLRLPLVYNTGGYDSVDTLRLLDGVVDIYMPDLKFMDPKVAEQLANAPDYPEVVQAAICEMHRQVGDLVLDESGVARRGLLVRHLVMPGGKAGTREAMRFLARQVSPNTYVNIMRQYHPEGYAFRYPEINRPVSLAEWREAVAIARQEGIHRLDE